MARLPYVDPNDPNLDEAVRAFMARSGGDVVNVVRALANNGRALRALGELSRVGDQITKGQRELSYLTTSLLNNCHY